MTNTRFLKGIGLGLMVGSAVGMAISPRKKSCKTPLSRALRSVSDMLERLN